MRSELRENPYLCQTDFKSAINLIDSFVVWTNLAPVSAYWIAKWDGTKSMHKRIITEGKLGFQRGTRRQGSRVWLDKKRNKLNYDYRKRQSWGRGRAGGWKQPADWRQRDKILEQHNTIIHKGEIASGKGTQVPADLECVRATLYCSFLILISQVKMFVSPF